MLTRIRQEIENPTPNADVLDALRDIGRAAIRAAAESKRTGNFTLNQMEAFAFGVYFNGKAYRQGYLDENKYRGDHDVDGVTKKGAEKDPKRHKYGRSQALHAIRDYKPDHRGYVLYLTNAMWYSTIHEAWGLPIITQEVKNAAARIASEFGVDVYINFRSYPYS